MTKQSKPITDGILVVTGDMHTNSLGGLMPPRVRLLSGNDIKANPAQRLLWRGWIKTWAEIALIKKRHKLPVIAIFNGDSVDKNRHDPWDLHTDNPVEILHMAVKVVEPALDVCDSFAFTKGTEAHTGRHGWLEDKLAEDLGSQCHPSLLLKVGGQVFDIRHHPESNSIRPWTKGGGAMRSAKIVMDYFLDSGDRPPDWSIRNHVHHFEDSGRNHITRTLFIPAWQAPGVFLHRIGFGAKMPEFGLVYFVCKGGAVIEWDILRVAVKRSKPQRMEMMT